MFSFTRILFEKKKIQVKMLTQQKFNQASPDRILRIFVQKLLEQKYRHNWLYQFSYRIE